jgi:hypothetical protein
VAPVRAVVEHTAARLRGEAIHKAVEQAMMVGQAPGGEPVGPLVADLLPLLTDRETLKVIHRKLHDLGWHRPWGYDQHHALYKALCTFFGDDDAHLR